MSDTVNTDNTVRLCPRCGLLVTIGHGGNLLQHLCYHDEECSGFYPPCEKCKTQKAPPGTRAMPPGVKRRSGPVAASVPQFGSMPRSERPKAPQPPSEEEMPRPAEALGHHPAGFQRSLFGDPEPVARPAPEPRPGLPRKAKHAIGSDTSRAAAESLSDAVLNELQLRVLEAIIGSNGLTCDEVELQLDLRHQTASARINELVKAKYVEDSGERRDTSSGRKATVWKATGRTE